MSPLMPSPDFLKGLGISASTIIDATAILCMYKPQKIAILCFILLLFFFHNLQLAQYIPKRCRKSDIIYFHTAFKEWRNLANRVTGYAAANLRN